MNVYLIICGLCNDVVRSEHHIGSREIHVQLDGREYPLKSSLIGREVLHLCEIQSFVAISTVDFQWVLS
jgi:hypothetical protein